MPRRTPPGLRIADVERDSPAERAGLNPGDIVVAVDGAPVPDELDWRFRTVEPHFVVTVDRAGHLLSLPVSHETGEPLGVTFEDLLGDGVHICNNRCVFCFIHQMPSGMRRSLYVRDDDFRLSFVHGNYITLTNLSEEELQRIVTQRLSPLYVSVHATDPAVRGMLLGRRDDAPVMERLRWLASHRINIHAQIVLCPGLNDGPVLEQTVSDLASLHPADANGRHGVLSVAIVPVGLTRYRDRLPKLTAPDGVYARHMIAWARRVSNELRKRLGTRFVWLSDEWYFLAGVLVPSRRHYEGFPQLEDGVGTTRLFLDELRQVVKKLPAASPRPHRALLVTGELAADVVRKLADALNGVAGLNVTTVAVPNRWFGGTISAAGLLTGRDIVETLSKYRPDGTVYLPDICLRDRTDALLDDMTIADLETLTGRRVHVTPPRPRALAGLLGLTPSGSIG